MSQNVKMRVNGSGFAELEIENLTKAKPPEEKENNTTLINPLISSEEYIKLFQEQMNEEINRLWQRSIFLGAFLTLIFTGYGVVLFKICEIECECQSNGIHKLHLVSIGISILGIIFSALWIMMAKGSKAWQEKYERGFFKFTEKEWEGNSNLKGIIDDGLGHGRLPEIEFDNFSNFLLFPKAGAYSPSKINIMIGIISLLVWIVISAVHTKLVCIPEGHFLSIFFISYSVPVVICLFLFVIVFFCRSWNIQKIQNKAEAKIIQNKAKAKIDEDKVPAKTIKTFWFPIGILIIIILAIFFVIGLIDKYFILNFSN